MKMKKVMVGMPVTALFFMIQVSLAHAIDIGYDIGVAYYTWKEDTSLGTVKESGPIWTLGWFLSSSLSPEMKTLRGHGNVEIFWGEVDYDTKTQTGVPVNTNTDYLGFKIEASAGWPIVFESMDENEEIKVDEDIRDREDIEASEPIENEEDKKRILASVEPFVGLAFRMWDRIIESSVSTLGTPVTGNPELYRTLYARIGIRASYNLTSNVALQSTLSLDPMLLAREKADIGQVLTLKNGKRLGWEVDTGVRAGKFNAAVYWQATRFGKSNVVACCFQPKSDQDIIGIKLEHLF